MPGMARTIHDLEYHLEEILVALGLDPKSEHLKNTPLRMAKMYMEFFANVHREFEEWTLFSTDESKNNQIIMADNIKFTSVCSHHFLPFQGRAWVLYLPNKHIAGASKLARVVEHYSKRPQVQEKLCHEIIRNIDRNLCPRGSMVVMRAVHACMSCRGVKQDGAQFVTSSASGVFLDDMSAKTEAMSLVTMSMEK